MDVQNDFVTGSLGSKEAEAIIPKVAELIRDKSYDYVVFTQDTHNEMYLETHEGKFLPVKHCIKYSPGWDFPDEIREAMAARGNADQIWVVEKSAFGSEDLIRDNSLFYERAVDIVGLCTDICVISNALMIRSFYPEVDIRVIANACAGVTPKKHQAALEVMKSCHIDVVEE